MSFYFSELNTDQLDNLAKLCFDLAKGALVFIVIPGSSTEELSVKLTKIFFSLFAGIAFTYLGLLLLKLKED
ncbi:MAG TPA: hypothetical protein VLF89_08050 [Candidatus Saccharimonadales bacterium]|nr:hypothetical protein [Candidatus Saccharimonadales bacterium]